MRKHFILTLGRSGSTYLVNVLNAHGSVFNYGEVLGNWLPERRIQKKIGLYSRDDAGYLDFLLSNPLPFHVAQLGRSFKHLRRGQVTPPSARRSIETIGVKEFSLNLVRSGIADYLKDRDDIQVICLRRRSTLDRTVSWLTLSKTGVVARAASETRDTATDFAIDPAVFVRSLSAVDEENRRLEEIADAIPSPRVLRIDYEDIFDTEEKKRDILTRVFLHIGVEPRMQKEKSRKIITKKPEEFITNFLECRNAAEQAGLAHLLGESMSAAGVRDAERSCAAPRP